MASSIDLDTALARMLDDLEAGSGRESVRLDAALGRVAAVAPRALSTVPPFANSAMDGYAVRSTDARLAAGDALRVVETIFAGAAPREALADGSCARIFTGAPLPAGADAVIAQEDALPDGDLVRFTEQPSAGRFVRAAGGDVARDAELFEAGTRLHAGHVALLAAAGLEAIEVVSRPRVAVLATGDELRPPGTELAPGQIHDTSSHALPALLANLPVTVSSVEQVPDDPVVLRDAFERAAAGADAVVSTGGVSVGDADHVRDVLGGGGHIDFWRLAIKPGRPFAYGRYRGLPFFGLPGNPVSSMVTFLLLVRPALLRLAGAAPAALPRIRVTLASDVRKAPGRRDFQRARRMDATTGAVRAHAFERQDSNVLSVLADADLLLDLPADAGDLPAGSEVHAIDLAGLLGPR